MPHVAFLVLAHRGAAQVGRLTRRLSGPGARVYLHVDAKADQAAFAASAAPETVVLDEPVDVRWGGWGMVEATLRLIDRALLDAPDHLYLMSGQDYPLRSLPAILDAVRAADTDWINVVPMSNNAVDKPIARVTARLQPVPLVGRVWARRLKLGFHLANRVLPPVDPARLAPDVALYGGASWWCLTADTMRLARAYLAEAPGLIQLLRRAHCPDEALFQTALMAVAPDRPRRPQPTYVRWDKRHGSVESPMTLTADMVEDACASEALMARKFDAELHPAALDRLDALAAAP